GAPTEVTYWQDMVPLFEQHCLQCHQQGGIGPVRLDQYSEAKRFAALIAYDTKARVMPPWHATSDGSCGEFQGSLALSDEQIERIAAWVRGGAQEGTPGQVKLPAVDQLAKASEYALPTYVPVAQGGALAENDDYHCFVVEPNVTEQRYITGYDIAPGTSEIVHHVVVSVVDPSQRADIEDAEVTNAQLMAKLEADAPDGSGYPCFSPAGDGVNARSTPVVWAPGQGVVRFPGESGVLVRPTDKLVIQVHYNLSDPKQRGKSDATRVRFDLASQVRNLAIFATPDALLESLFVSPEPHTLEPGKPSVLYSFKRSLAELELEDDDGSLSASQSAELKLWGVMPHMHERGHKLQMRIKPSATSDVQCGVDVQSWDFHWQRMYFYQQPWKLDASAELEVTCDFDTSSAQQPVLPGWGTNNEMCLTTLFFTVPVR
ncbi:MAG TPA: cytochrome c, partial [Polyangiales bacterium]